MTNATISKSLEALKAAKPGDRVRVESPELRKPRVLIVTSVETYDGGTHVVFTTSGRVRPGSISGGSLRWNPKYDTHVWYQPTMLQQVRPVSDLDLIPTKAEA